MIAGGWRMPAEWERHDATWIAWPHEESDWLEKFSAVQWVYAEIVRVLSRGERVEILVSESVHEHARSCLRRCGLGESAYRLHRVATDRSWLRDSAPTAVRGPGGEAAWMGWRFNAWAKYDNFKRDQQVPAAIAELSTLPLITALRPDNGAPLVLEGGAIDSDGEGTLMVTEECLLSQVQERNPGLAREGYERAFAEYLGIRKTIWLDRGVAGDDTHGHIDDIARFVGPGKVVLVYDEDPQSDFHSASRENAARLRAAKDAQGRKLEVILLPMPRTIEFGDERLPASYANFYITNTAVMVPTFNDVNDLKALAAFAQLFPEREVIGIYCGDLIMGQGALHCLAQPQFSSL